MAEVAPDDAALFRSYLESDRVSLARRVLEQARAASEEGSDPGATELVSLAKAYGRMPLGDRQAFARKLVAGVTELGHGEIREASVLFRTALPVLRGVQPSKPLQRNVQQALQIVRQQGVPASDTSAVLQAAQDEAMLQARENPLPIVAAFADMPVVERNKMLDELTTVGLLPPEHREAAQRVFSTDTHGLLAFVVLLYGLRWVIVVLPVLELLLWLFLPLARACHFFGTCDADDCALPSWLLRDALLMLLLFAAAYTVGRSCLLLADRFRTDSVAMAARLRAACERADSEGQAKELGVEADDVRSAKVGFLVMVAVVLAAMLWAVVGCVKVVANIASCGLLAFVLVTFFVGLKVCLCAAVCLLLGSMVLTLVSPGGPTRTGQGYGSIA